MAGVALPLLLLLVITTSHLPASVGSDAGSDVTSRRVEAGPGPGSAIGGRPAPPPTAPLRPERRHLTSSSTSSSSSSSSSPSPSPPPPAAVAPAPSPGYIILNERAFAGMLVAVIFGTIIFAVIAITCTAR